MLLDVEPVFIASILRYPECLVDISGELPPAHIENEQLRNIYEEAIKLFSEGHTVSAPAVYQRCKKNITPTKFASLIDDIPSKVNIPHYAGEINRIAQKSRIKTQLLESIKLVDHVGIDELLGDLSKIIADETHEDKKNPQISEAVKRHDSYVEHNKKHGVGFLTGFIFFDDHKMVRYSPCHIWVLGGFTSVGKTSFMVEMLSRVNEMNPGIKTMVISTEMDTNQNITKLITRKTQIHSFRVISGEFEGEGREAINNCKKEISGWSMKIYDDLYELSEICGAIKKAQMVDGINVVWVDYLQNITVKGARSEYEATDLISKSFQKLAKQCKCTIILMSQLSNDAAKDDDGILKFKGGGSIAAVTDLGFIMKRDKDDKTKLMLDMRKNRHGPLGTQVFQFTDKYTRLKEIPDGANS